MGTWDAKFFIFEDDSSWAVSSTHSRLGIGPAVSLSGGYALIGAPYDSANNYSGSAYVFKKVGSAWVQTAKLLPSIGGDGNFGRSVAISGNNALVGAGGSAYVFRREGEGWTEIARLVASDGTVTDGFGAAVSLFANYAIVSAGGNDGCAEDAGAAYIFRRAGGSWNEVQKLTSSDCRTNDSFGWAVSMNDRFAAVGTNSSITPFLDRTFLYSAYIESESEFSNLDSKPFLMTSVLFKNYPDPFNPSTTISYNLIENTHVTLKVYNTVGQLVKTVVEDYQAEGYHEMIWDGRNEVGATVSSGIYIYRMTAGSFVETKRMLLLK